MDFTRPKRCPRQRTRREDRRSNFYEISDNLLERAGWLYSIGVRMTKPVAAVVAEIAEHAWQ
ncbi:MAG: hypothetical protein WBL06_11140, partial [Pseudolysinimonas sp.]|uniref:hypothetical protein n=1 Tax=Pseudolysinimonas sp. TaxID=2680009 RepID=UPI003C784F46